MITVFSGLFSLVMATLYCTPKILLDEQTHYISNSDPGYKEPLFRHPFFFASSLLLDHFFYATYFAPQHERLDFYPTSFNVRRRVTLSFSPSCPSLSYHD
jgi:hypothetical protein